MPGLVDVRPRLLNIVTHERTLIRAFLSFSGGKFGGFGSSPDPPQNQRGTSSHPSFSLSSHNAPSLSEFQSAPLSALTKSWGLFSSAVAVAGSTINDSVLQPGVARAGETIGQIQRDGYGGGVLNTDKLLADAKATGGWLGSVAGEGWSNLNKVVKDASSGAGGSSGSNELDLSAGLRGMGLGPTKNEKFKGFGGGGGRDYYDDEAAHEYGSLPREAEEAEEDGWKDWDSAGNEGTKSSMASTNANVITKSVSKPTDKKGDWDNEWKDF